MSAAPEIAVLLISLLVLERRALRYSRFAIQEFL
jgi:hypothetical protein